MTNFKKSQRKHDTSTPGKGGSKARINNNNKTRKKREEEATMGFVAGMLMAVVAVAVLVVTVVSVPATGSVMLSSFSWSDCGE